MIYSCDIVYTLFVTTAYYDQHQSFLHYEDSSVTFKSYSINFGLGLLFSLLLGGPFALRK